MSVAGNIDFLPTFAALAGAALPGGEKLDGQDITPLFAWPRQESPPQAYFNFAGNALQAVRAAHGNWQLPGNPKTRALARTRLNPPRHRGFLADPLQS